MFDVITDEKSVTVKLSNTMDLADRAIQACDKFVRQHAGGNTNAARAVLYELLRLAVEQGNGSGPEFELKCRVEHTGGNRFRIEVKGEGQDLEMSRFSLDSGPGHERNSGMSLVKTLADDVKLDQDRKSVSATITVLPDTEFTVRAVDGGQMIVPTGDLTESTADALRGILIDLLRQGCVRYHLDFARVMDIDSVSLSVLIHFKEVMRKQHAEAQITIENSTDDLVNLFRSTRLNEEFQIQT